MKIGAFGTLPPLTERLSSASSGMLILMSKSPSIEKINFYGQTGCQIPVGVEPGKVQIKDVWRIGSPVSLVRAMVHMLRDREPDAYFFNASLTMFGAGKLSNAVGLLVPSILAKLTRKRVVVYMHDFIETEEPAKLGYRVGIISRVAASFLEKLLIDSASIIVPRPSQKAVLERKYRRPITTTVIPYLEGLSGLACVPEGISHLRDGKRVEILLFGKWGPQKDLRGALNLLSDIIRVDGNVHVTIAGGINPNFPEYRETMLETLEQFSSDNVEYVDEVPDDDVPELFRGSDILFLPYVASGGYSGVMNLGALYNLKVIAYDVKQLRESDSLIRANTLFFDPASPSSVGQIRAAIAEIRQSRETKNDVQGKAVEAGRAFQPIIDKLTESKGLGSLSLKKTVPALEYK